MHQPPAYAGVDYRSPTAPMPPFATHPPQPVNNPTLPATNPSHPAYSPPSHADPSHNQPAGTNYSSPFRTTQEDQTVLPPITSTPMTTQSYPNNELSRLELPPSYSSLG